MLANQCRIAGRTMWRGDGLAIDWELQPDKGVFRCAYPTGWASMEETHRETWIFGIARKWQNKDKERRILRTIRNPQGIDVHWDRVTGRADAVSDAFIDLTEDCDPVPVPLTPRSEPHAPAHSDAKTLNPQASIGISKIAEDRVGIPEKLGQANAQMRAREHSSSDNGKTPINVSGLAPRRSESETATSQQELAGNEPVAVHA